MTERREPVGSDATPQARSWRANLGSFMKENWPLFALIIFFALLVCAIMKFMPTRAEIDADEAARKAKKEACDHSGPKNAKAWAEFMGIKSSAIRCHWMPTFGIPGCGDMAECDVSVGDGATIVAIWCSTSNNQTGDPGVCQLAWK